MGGKQPFFVLHRGRRYPICHFSFNYIFKSSTCSTFWTEFDLVHPFWNLNRISSRGEFITLLFSLLTHLNTTVLLLRSSNSSSGGVIFILIILPFTKSSDFSISSLVTLTSLVSSIRLFSFVFDAAAEAKLRFPPLEVILENGATQHHISSITQWKYSKYSNKSQSNL